MNYVVDEVKRSRKEDVSILTHPLIISSIQVCIMNYTRLYNWLYTPV